MGTSYSGDPNDSNLDAVRFLAQDTGTDDTYHLQDEEISWLLTENASNVYLAAAQAARAIAGKFSGKQGKSVGDVSVFSGSDQATAYLQLAKSLDARAMRSAWVPTPYAGGRTVAETDADADDDSIRQPSFRIGMTDND